jgi:hypothetical protein
MSLRRDLSRPLHGEDKRADLGREREGKRRHKWKHFALLSLRFNHLNARRNLSFSPPPGRVRKQTIRRNYELI